MGRALETFGSPRRGGKQEKQSRPPNTTAMGMRLREAIERVEKVVVGYDNGGSSEQKQPIPIPQMPPVRQGPPKVHIGPPPDCDTGPFAIATPILPPEEPLGPALVDILDIPDVSWL